MYHQSKRYLGVWLARTQTRVCWTIVPLGKAGGNLASQPRVRIPISIAAFACKHLQQIASKYPRCTTIHTPKRPPTRAQWTQMSSKNTRQTLCSN